MTIVKHNKFFTSNYIFNVIVYKYNNKLKFYLVILLSINNNIEICINFINLYLSLVIYLQKKDNFFLKIKKNIEKTRICNKIINLNNQLST